MGDAVSRFLCWMFGHKWSYLMNAIPEDRQSFRCDRCGGWGFRPARNGEREVPEDYTRT